MKNKNDKKRKRTGFKQEGIRYAAAVVWIILTCFVKHFRKNTSYLFRRCVVAAVICVMAVAAILFVEVSHSSMELEETHLVLCMSQKENVVEEGYEHPVVCELVLENDGRNDLTDVSLYIDGRQEGFTLQLENGGEVLPAGGRWKAKVVMDPGCREGEILQLAD